MSNTKEEIHNALSGKIGKLANLAIDAEKERELLIRFRDLLADKFDNIELKTLFRLGYLNEHKLTEKEE